IDPRPVVRGRRATGPSSRTTRARGAPAGDLGGLGRGEDTLTRAPPRLAASHGVAVAVTARRRRPPRRLPPVSDPDKDAVPRPQRSVDRTTAGARPAVVRARDREGARADLWSLVPSRRRSRHDLRARRTVHAIPDALPSAAAGVVPGSGAR